jgi:hypothetical protein
MNVLRNVHGRGENRYNIPLTFPHQSDKYRFFKRKLTLTEPPATFTVLETCSMSHYDYVMTLAIIN